jgi:hypothetical protein
MTCTPLKVAPGLFYNSGGTAWSTAPSASLGGHSVTRSASGITFSGSTGGGFHATVGTNTSKYRLFGAGFLVILESETSIGLITHTVTLVDFTTSSPTERLLYSVLAKSTVDQPHIHPSPTATGFTDGIAFLTYAPNDVEDFTNLGIYRSDTGKLLCAGPPPFPSTLDANGEATATDLIIHYSTGGASAQVVCPLPLGRLTVSPGSQLFGNVAVGGCPITPPTRTFTLKNDGNDCLTVSAIGSVAPFSLASTSTPLPAELSPGQIFTATISFNPTGAGSFGPTNLPITRTPANGADHLSCSGMAHTAAATIAYSPSPVVFGSVRVGTTATRNLTISNTGESPLNVTVGGSSGGPFSWSGWSGAIPCGSSHVIPVTFSPTAEGLASAMLSVTSNAPGSPASISVTGEGCVPNAVIAVPTAPFPAFGQVQRGFRTVRFFTIRNTGDGQLTFQAHLTGADAGLFYLVDPAGGTITSGSSSRSYVAEPVVRCGGGPAGSGQVSLPVVFFANAAPRVITDAHLVIDSHNGTNTPPASFTFDLAAEIIAGITVDAALVIDRSGSMADPLGSRQKIDAAIAGGRLFVELMRPDVDDRMAIVRFDHESNALQPIVAITSGNQASVENHINATDLSPRGSTAIAAGVSIGANEVNTPRGAPPAMLTKCLVVLTDGKDNTAYQPPGDSNWYTILGNPAWDPAGNPVSTLQLPLPAGIKVYGIGLGTDAQIDTMALGRLSSLTGGYFGVVSDLTGTAYFNLEKYYTQVFMDVVANPTILDPVYTINPGDTQVIEFDVLRGDVSAIIVFYDKDGWRLPFYALSPTGEVLEPSSIPVGYQLRAGFTPEARFMEFRMPLLEPDRYAGRWSVVVEHPGKLCEGPPYEPQERKRGFRTSKDRIDAPHGFVSQKCRPWGTPVDYGIAVGVGSNFRMQPYVSPGAVQVGDPIQLSAAITEAGLPVTECVVTVTATSPSGSVWSMALIDDGAHGDGDPADGEFGRVFNQTSEEGSYQFHFRAEGISRDGEPVVREAMRAKYVEGRFTSDPCHHGHERLQPRKPVDRTNDQRERQRIAPAGGSRNREWS